MQTACGFGVPLMGNGTPAGLNASQDGQTPYEDRPTLGDWARKMNKEKLFDYQKNNNSTSLDGLPGLKSVRRAQGHMEWMDAMRTKAMLLLTQKDALLVGIFIGVLLMMSTRIAGLLV